MVNDVDDDGDGQDPWTPEGADRLASAAQRLAAAIGVHAVTLSAAGRRDFSTVLAADDTLLPAVLDYADAQFNYTGGNSPFDVLRQFDDDDDDDDEDEAVGERPTLGISIIRRHDFVVIDEGNVLSSGRAAYLRVWPDDTDEDAAADVAHVGRALYQIGHADGWDSLERVDGLRPLGGITRVIGQSALLGANRDEWPSDVFAAEGEVLYEQSDIVG